MSCLLLNRTKGQLTGCACLQVEAWCLIIVGRTKLLLKEQILTQKHFIFFLQVSARPFEYGTLVTKSARQGFKEDELRRHPDNLFYDITGSNKVCNLIFYTGLKEQWTEAIGRAFPGIIRTRGDPIQLVRNSKNFVSVHNNGKIVIQGRLQLLQCFDRKFNTLRNETTG